MNLRHLAIFSALLIGLMLFQIVWVLDVFGNDHGLVQLSMILGGFFLVGSLIWIGYTYYLIYRLLPKVDPLVDYDSYRHLKDRGDFLLYRVHRLTLYALSAASRWANRRLYPECDFASMPRNIRIPLKLHTYWLWSNCAAMLVGALVMSIVDHLGLS